MNLNQFKLGLKSRPSIEPGRELRGFHFDCRRILAYKNRDGGIRAHASNNLVIDEVFCSDSSDNVDFSTQNNCTLR
jgi:hypothetical protein